MKHKQALRIGSFLLIIVIVLTLWASVQPNRITQKAVPEYDVPTIDPALLTMAKSSDSLDYLIYFEEKADLTGAYDMPWEERGWYVYERLVAQADESQAKVRKYLEKQRVTYEPFWIQNVIAVESSSFATLKGLQQFLEIHSLQAVPEIFLYEPSATSPDEKSIEPAGTSSNLQHINVTNAWSLGFTGEGMVVGSIDTGVRFTHEALVDQYRGNKIDGLEHDHHWWDAVSGRKTPYDDQGHGSHTIGIMVGAKETGDEIGVAPGAKYVACKAINGNGTGFGWDFLECGQFMLAPWDLAGENLDPNLRPHVVNNSWGSCDQHYSSWFADAIDAWVAAGIYPVFSNGNAANCGYSYPPALNTVGNPARAYNVTAVGSTGMDNGEYANYSTWGPTDSEDTVNPSGYPWIKPQVVAPGVDIRSAVASSDNTYGYWSGTSMSAPHVSGLVTLMWEAGGCLLGDYATTETLIQESAVPIPYATGNGDEGPENVPNHATGWGEIDVLEAVTSAQNYCNSGALKGYVFNANSNQPVFGASVEALPQGDSGNSRFTETDQNGFYSLRLDSDLLYDITVTKNGYQPETASMVGAIPSEASLTRDFYLPPNTTVVSLSGTVTDGSGHGYPLYAQILLDDGENQQTVYTDPFDGTYTVDVFEDTIYDMAVTSVLEGYQDIHESDVNFFNPNETRDYALTVDVTCEAPGYDISDKLYQTFDENSKPEGWTVTDAAGTGIVWQFDGPGDRFNLTGGSGFFAAVDSDLAGKAPVDTSLISPAVSFSNLSSVVLSFDQDFDVVSEEEGMVADVDVSIDSGGWQNILRQRGGVDGPDHQEMDISDLVANQADVRIRFHLYSANPEGYWQIDNVRLGSNSCVKTLGGVLAGFVTNENNGEAINGARIATDGVRVVTGVNPKDPNLKDGFYWLFQPLKMDPEEVDVTISRLFYRDRIIETQVHQDEITQQDYTLVSIFQYLAECFKELWARLGEYVYKAFA